ncbi:hypothetical protein C8Q76DRAFT_630402 [Earliella scabrosa]|nr:hypothetical protein C8Q76DRAFT_630402 [Earliella scabrosa]
MDPANCSIVASSPQFQQAAADALKGYVTLLIIVSFLPALLVPTAAVLFFFSTPQIRQRPIFILNASALVVGMALGGQSIYNSQTVGLIGKPLSPTFAVVMAALILLVPVAVQSILLLRVIAVYPPSRLSWARRLLVYGPFVILKIGRAVNGGFYLANLYKDTNSVALSAGPVSWRLPGTKVELLLQLIDNTFASCLFLLRLREGRVLSTRQETMIDSGAVNIQRPLPLTVVTCAQRMKALFWIAVFNFVFPVMLNIAVLVIRFRDPDFLHGTYVLYFNYYFDIIGVLLATIWVSGKNSQTLRDHPPMPVALPTCQDTLSTSEFSAPSRLSPCMEFSTSGSGTKSNHAL